MDADAHIVISEKQAREAHRMREAIHLQEIEGNPFTAEDFELLEMFEREGWSTDQCRAYILDRVKRA
jgi:hypothetical protein